MALIKLLPSDESVEAIERYISENNIPNPKKSFHSTLIYTEETPILEISPVEELILEKLPFKISQDTFFWDLFEGYLVLRYSDRSVTQLHWQLNLELMRQTLLITDYIEAQRARVERSLRVRESPVYDLNPHMSISRDFEGNVRMLPVFVNTLTFDNYEIDRDFPRINQ